MGKGVCDFTNKYFYDTICTINKGSEFYVVWKEERKSKGNGYTTSIT